MALITFANPEKNCFPCSKFWIATNSSKEAPAQKAFSPSDFKTITATASLVEIAVNSFAKRSNNSLGNELLAGCPNSIVAIFP